ncbi:hypothetical protein BCR34DRAFT_473319 [Clohesyomyces aquaticus]|uniref:Uncharacterized protein n=1 Tax=Clohesyomyces aquaticus TaxID=1231657 RepID=A0A1Y2A8B3_9PLEO|nr:hypothetical protein BCR34DRAFT_473319 [Clohesyomyces aquaticus]
MSLSPNFHYGLPKSPRPNNMLFPINTSPSAPSSPRFDSGATSPASQASEKPQLFIDTRARRRESMIFVNATIPLSPVSSLTGTRGDRSNTHIPGSRKRSGIAKWFSCFGSEAREKRKRQYGDFERMEDVHWTEL